MFCTVCGSEMDLKTIDKEGSIPYCKSCDKLFFPKVDIAMIAVLTNNLNQVCLVNQNQLSQHKVLIAGYIKPGETIEECVKREILEEVGVEIERCTYLKSHFYDNRQVLMVGFHAVTNNHNLVIDKNEIDSASWYELDDALWRIREGSIAYLLYQQFLEENNQSNS